MLRSRSIAGTASRSKINLKDVEFKTLEKTTKTRFRKDDPSRESMTSLEEQMRGGGATKSMAGTVVFRGEGSARVSGIADATVGSVVRFESGVEGLVSSLERSDAAVVLLRKGTVNEGDTAEVVASSLEFQVPVGGMMDGCGAPIGKGDQPDDPEQVKVVVEPWSAAHRRKWVSRGTRVSTPLWSGNSAIDLLAPLGHGQSVAMVGEEGSGTSEVAQDIVLAQARGGMGPAQSALHHVVYVTVGDTVARGATRLAGQFEALLAGNTDAEKPVLTCIAAEPMSGLGVQFMAPYLANAFADSLREQGKRVLVVYDGVTAHTSVASKLCKAMDLPSVGKTSLLSNLVSPVGVDASGGAMTALFAVSSTSAVDGARTASQTVDAITSMSDLTIRIDARHMRKFGGPVDPMNLVHLQPPTYQPGALKGIASAVKRALVEYRTLNEAQTMQRQLGIEIEPDAASALTARKHLMYVLGQGLGSPPRDLASSAVMAIMCLHQDGVLTEHVPDDQIGKLANQTVEFMRLEHADLMGKLKSWMSLQDAWTANSIDMVQDDVHAKMTVDVIGTFIREAYPSSR